MKTSGLNGFKILLFLVLCCASLVCGDTNRYQSVRAYSRFSDCKSPIKSDSNGMEAWTERLVPSIENDKIKGYMGTVGVLGGHTEDTGAPFFAAMGALRVGADEVHIFCYLEAADALRFYSPDFRVRPILNQEGRLLQEIVAMDVIVMGPGLAPDAYSIQLVAKVINLCKQHKKPLVLDLEVPFWTVATANALIMMTYPGVIITPNIPEFEKLYTEMKLQGDASNTHATINFAKYGNYIFFLRKGCTDQGMSANPFSSWSISEGGSAKRSSGQGHLLAGITGTYFFWATKYLNVNETVRGHMFPAAVASYSAAKLVRSLSRRGYESHSRSMASTDMIDKIQAAMEEEY